MNAKDRYRYYFFFLKDPGVISEERRELLFLPEGALYAYTDEKAKAKLWESQRNRKLFFKERVDLTRAELNDLVAVFPNGHILFLEGRGMEETYDTFDYKLAITMFEHTHVMMEANYLMLTELMKIDFPYTLKIFCQPLQHLLVISVFAEQYGLVGEELPFKSYPIQPNLFHIFIHIYQSLLKE